MSEEDQRETERQIEERRRQQIELAREMEEERRRVREYIKTGRTTPRPADKHAS